MGPAAHQARTLVVQMRQFDLKRAFAGGGAFAEDFQDDGGAVQHLAVPRLLQVALLDRRQVRVHDDHIRLLIPGQDADLFDLPAADQGCGRRPRQRRHQGFHHVKVDGGRQANRFGQARLCVTQRRIGAAAVLGFDMDDERFASQIRLRPARPGAGSGPSASLSKWRACRPAGTGHHGAAGRRNCQTR